MKLFSVIIAVVAFIPFTANAYFIVNTGSGLEGVASGPSLNQDQWIAGQFTTNRDSTIQSIEGWMNSVDEAQTGTISIYADDGSLPGSQLYSTQFLGLAGLEAEWEGVFGLSWELSPGTYWVSFEVLIGQTIRGVMPLGSPRYLPIAVNNASGGTAGSWRFIDLPPFNLRNGIRIDVAGNRFDAPEPGTLALLTLGLLGMGLARRRKQLS